MVVQERGYHYTLKGLENSGDQEIQFIHKQPKEEGSTELELVHGGTTNEEVIEMLLDRLTFLDELMPCMENKQVIKAISSAQEWLKRRTDERAKRGVEGKHVS